MGRERIKIPKSVIQKYLNQKEGKPVKILEYEELGSGWHGTGYKIKFKSQSAKVKSEVKEVVLRTLMPSNFSHDYKSDRAKVFILQHEMAKDIPSHIESFDVSGYTKDGELVSLGDVEEFFQIVEVAYGNIYSKDFQRIKETGKITDLDRNRARILADYLVTLHKKKLKGSEEETRSIRRRHSRDALGHGEMMLGVIDTYPDGFDFISKEGLSDFICNAVRFREKVKDIPFTPCRVHGDFHPANIMFDGEKIKVLDCSRQLYGDPADDVVAMAMNYIWFAIMQSGSFSGPFSELFDIFWNGYFQKSDNQHILNTAGVHLAFRAVVVAHPVFYSAQSNEVRRKIINFVNSVLKEQYFDSKKINEYLR